MAPKKPLRLDMKWWKENYPKSMPPNKAIEELIKDFDAKPPTKVGPALSKAATKGTDKKDVEAAKPRYSELVAEIKRTKAMLTKAKHDDLAKIFDEIVKQVNTEKEAMEAISEKAFKLLAEADPESQKLRGWDMSLNMLTNHFNPFLSKVQAQVKKADAAVRAQAADTKGDKKERAEAMVRQAGIVRHLMVLMRAERKKLEADLQDVKADVGKDDEAKEFATKGGACLKGFDKQEAALEALEKDMVTLFMTAFGDAGKKLFAAAKPVPVKL